MKNSFKLKNALLLSFLVISTFTNFIQGFPLISNDSNITDNKVSNQVDTYSSTNLADGGSLYQQDIIGCVGDPDLNNPIYPQYIPPAVQPDPSIYAYTFLISNAVGTILLNLDTPSLNTLPPGEYTVCGLSYRLEDTPLLATILGQTVLDLQESFDNQTASFCGDTSDDCFNLTIDIPNPPIVIDTMICIGDAIILPDGTPCISPGVCSCYVDLGTACPQEKIYIITPILSTTATIDTTIYQGECVIIAGNECCDLTQIIQLENVAGCDSILIVNINFIIENSPIFIDTAACAGTMITLPDGSLCQAGNTCSYFIDAGGNNTQEIIYVVAPLSLTTETIDITLCEGECVTIEGVDYCESNQEILLENTVGCDSILSLNIAFETISAEITQTVAISCFNETNGQATLTVNPDEDYSFLWDNGETALSVDNLSSGNHTVIVSNSLGCEKTLSFFIESPADLSISISSTNSQNQDNNGTATVDIEGGISPYSVQWNTVPVQNGLVATGLSPGEYMATITDENGCTQTIGVSIELTTSLSENKTFASFSMFPNPAKDWLHFELNLEKSELIKWELRNLLGQIVLKEDFPMHSNRMQEEINLSDYSGNLFFLTVFVNDKKQTYKVIKIGK